MSLVHHNIINSYCVDIENQELTLNTVYNCNEINEVTSIIFSGYLTHTFKHIVHSNIIFSITEESIDTFIKYNARAIEEGKHHCWPILYEGKDDLKKYLDENEIKAFEIGSSLGLTGWILAREMVISSS